MYLVDDMPRSAPYRRSSLSKRATERFCVNDVQVVAQPYVWHVRDVAFPHGTQRVNNQIPKTVRLKYIPHRPSHTQPKSINENRACVFCPNLDGPSVF